MKLNKLFGNKTNPKSLNGGGVKKLCLALCLSILVCILGSSFYANAATYTELETISGYGYTASIHGIDNMNKNCTRWWSSSTGSNASINNRLKNGTFYNDSTSVNYGAKSQNTVTFIGKTWIDKKGVIEFNIRGTSCSHSGSKAQVYVYKLNESGTWDKVWTSAEFIVNPSTSQGVAVSSKQRYRVDESGYYKAEGWGYAYGCNTSDGHGIFIESSYKYLKCVEQYTIKYNANGGSGAPSQHSYTWDSTVGTIGGIKSDIPTRDGYIFKGWARTSAWNSKRIISNLDTSTTASRDGVTPTVLDDDNELFEYEDGLGYSRGSLPKTIQLYAMWEEIPEYNISYDKGLTSN